jgi:hypothetical protein
VSTYDTLSTQPDAISIARSIAAGRVFIGVAAFLLPRLVGRTLLGKLVDEPGGAAAVRTIGVRDLALGAGLLVADRRGRPVRGWLEAGGAVDALDCFVAIFAGRGVPLLSRLLIVLIGGGAAVTGAMAASGLSERGESATVD